MHEFFEPHAIFRDEKAIAILPKLASDLSSILFAIPVDVAELNQKTLQPVTKTEPIIAVPSVSIRTIKASNSRAIVEFDETVKSKDDSGLKLPVVNSTKYQPEIDYSVNVPNFSETISICSNIEEACKNDDTTSISSSSSEDTNVSVNNQQMIDQVQNNEAVVKMQQQRIVELENKVEDLTLEITRLRGLLANSSQKNVGSLANFQIAIPHAVLNKTKT